MKYYLQVVQQNDHSINSIYYHFYGRNHVEAHILQSLSACLKIKRGELDAYQNCIITRGLNELKYVEHLEGHKKGKLLSQRAV